MFVKSVSDMKKSKMQNPTVYLFLYIVTVIVTKKSLVTLIEKTALA